MKAQVICVHGGTVFPAQEAYYEYLKSKQVDRVERPGWKEWVKKELTDSVEVFLPQMPNKRNADFQSWKIWFEKYLEFLEKDVPLVLIGHSLGASFLTKYLSEYELPKQVEHLFLVALPLYEENLEQEILGSFLPDASKLSVIENRCSSITLYHSEDDPVVDINNSKKFCNFVSSATLVEFSDKGHINQETFPELLEEIRKVL